MVVDSPRLTWPQHWLVSKVSSIRHGIPPSEHFLSSVKELLSTTKVCATTAHTGLLCPAGHWCSPYTLIAGSDCWLSLSCGSLHVTSWNHEELSSVPIRRHLGPVSKAIGAYFPTLVVTKGNRIRLYVLGFSKQPWIQTQKMASIVWNWGIVK